MTEARAGPGRARLKNWAPTGELMQRPEGAIHQPRAAHNTPCLPRAWRSLSASSPVSSPMLRSPSLAPELEVVLVCELTPGRTVLALVRFSVHQDETELLRMPSPWPAARP